jgi:hypothetical protein
VLQNRALDAENTASQLEVQLVELRDQIDDQESRIAFIDQVTTYAGLVLALVIVAIAFLYLRQRNT